MPFSARAIDSRVASSDCSASTSATASMIDSSPRTTRVAETACMSSSERSAGGWRRLRGWVRLTIVALATIVWTTVPDALSPRHLASRLLQIGVVLGIGVLLLVTLPGLGEVRTRFADARVEWVIAALAFEVGSVTAF